MNLWSVVTANGECQITCSTGPSILPMSMDRYTPCPGQQPSAWFKVWWVNAYHLSITTDFTYNCTVKPLKIVFYSPWHLCDIFFSPAAAPKELYLHMEDVFLGILRSNHCKDIDLIHKEEEISGSMWKKLKFRWIFYFLSEQLTRRRLDRVSRV